MGGTESKEVRWICDNVLFLDPDAPPFVCQETYERHRLSSQRSTGRLRGIQVSRPADPRIKQRAFKVLLELVAANGQIGHADCILKCATNPPSLQILDTNGELSKVIGVGHIRRVRREGELRVILDIDLPGPQDDRGAGRLEGGGGSGVLKCLLVEAQEASIFCEYLRELYGFVPDHYDQHDIDTKAAGATARESDATSMILCPVHGALPCNCAAAAGAMPDSFKVSTAYPVAIRGAAELGSLLSWVDLSHLGTKEPPIAIQWQVSTVLGNESKYDHNCLVYTQKTLRLTEDMVGKKVRLRVARGAKNNVTVSQAEIGPVTVDGPAARSILELLTTPNRPYSTESRPSYVKTLFPEHRDHIIALAKRQPFFTTIIKVGREHFEFAAPELGSAAVRIVPLEEFWLTRLSSQESSLSSGEETFLHFNFHAAGTAPPHDQKANASYFRTSFHGVKERNEVFHTYWFLRLSPSFKNFDRWAKDLANQNFSVFQQRYAKLWSAVTFGEVVEDTGWVDWAGQTDDDSELLRIEGRLLADNAKGLAGGERVDQYDISAHLRESDSSDDSDSDEDGGV